MSAPRLPSRPSARLRRDISHGERAATSTFEGHGSFLGVVIAAFSLVLLYIALSRLSAVSALVRDVTSWLAKFLSPNYPLFS
jgi:hypothetical protein